jgi:hypothetical protein
MAHQAEKAVSVLRKSRNFPAKHEQASPQVVRPQYIAESSRFHPIISTFSRLECAKSGNLFMFRSFKINHPGAIDRLWFMPGGKPPKAIE